MKKYLIGLFSILLISCGEDNVITRNGKPSNISEREIYKTYYVVTKIENLNDGLCQYCISTDSWFDYKWKIKFVDSIGKYSLNQHLYVTFETVK